jgi:Xaa-Pro aminopeptidase
MLSMEPAIKRGLTFWDRRLMPQDEYEERVRLIRDEMRREGLAALIVAGNMYEDAELLYVVGGNVDGVLVLPLEGEPAIFTDSGPRESFFLKHLTWIGDLSHRGALIGAAVREALAARGIAPHGSNPGRIGTAGLQVLTSRRHCDLVDALAGYAVEDAGPLLQKLRARPRPRERLAIRRALGIAETAAVAAERAFAAGGASATALIAAERAARLAGAWDFRALANLDSDELRPYEYASDDRRVPLLLWLAARYQGYWADRVVVSGAAPQTAMAAAALAAMKQAARPGASAAAVAAAGLALLSPAARAVAIEYGLGGGIGSTLDQAPRIAPESMDRIEAGCVLSLRVFVREEAGAGFTGALVEIDETGARDLEPL